MNEEIMGYLRIATVFISVFYGLWQHLQKRKLENFISNKAIAISRIISYGLGAVQTAKLQTLSNEIASKEIGRAEGLLNAALVDSADLCCNLKKTTIDDIDDLEETNDTIKNYKNIFLIFSDRKIGFFRKGVKWLAKLY